MSAPHAMFAAAAALAAHFEDTGNVGYQTWWDRDDGDVTVVLVVRTEDGGDASDWLLQRTLPIILELGVQLDRLPGPWQTHAEVDQVPQLDVGVP